MPEKICHTVPNDQVSKVIDTMLWSAKLSEIYRFKNQRFWEKETRESDYAMKIEVLRLESVADHSWHLADITLLLYPQFPTLNLEKCLCLAILHDKLEIITSDKSPIGKDGTGEKTYAFNDDLNMKKSDEELEALRTYVKKLEHINSQAQFEIIHEAIVAKSAEAHFIKGIDKLQALIFILRKKSGNIRDMHLRFSLRYARRSLEFFPELEPYYNELARRILLAVAEFRNKRVEEIEKIVFSDQLEFSFKIT